VDPPLPGALAQGVVWMQYRVENVHIVPVFGTGALNVSPRAGHLHIHVDDLPWWWADASDTNTIDIAGMPPGQHKMLIELVKSCCRKTTIRKFSRTKSTGTPPHSRCI
jgi:hypothetical protein